MKALLEKNPKNRPRDAAAVVATIDAVLPKLSDKKKGLFGMFWKGATLKGAFTGLSLGFLMWAYTLLLPSFARSGWLPIGVVTDRADGVMEFA